ncbi:hypothetical protein IE4771_PB00119 (plasmid) [Rhizobium etli bv. mimosae str. IE4771]|uniref:Uncharacterized protein n=1 Tax=Rhizobium etli bv. mimosae str. IE4771 TaxID=1432050 RepID=A0A060ICQ7_RHIET|nr:hypothetical protein IE4771_PB00119 [Rhizobium sp. IE4771]
MSEASHGNLPTRLGACSGASVARTLERRRNAQLACLVSSLFSAILIHGVRLSLSRRQIATTNLDKSWPTMP